MRVLDDNYADSNQRYQRDCEKNDESYHSAKVLLAEIRFLFKPQNAIVDRLNFSIVTSSFRERLVIAPQIVEPFQLSV